LTKHKEKGIIDIITNVVVDFKKLMEFDKGWNIKLKISIHQIISREIGQMPMKQQCPSSSSAFGIRLASG
jgi:hypothetical protein